VVVQKPGFVIPHDEDAVRKIAQQRGIGDAGTVDQTALAV
jgi:hypothetical protein